MYHPLSRQHVHHHHHHVHATTHNNTNRSNRHNYINHKHTLLPTHGIEIPCQGDDVPHQCDDSVRACVHACVSSDVSTQKPLKMTRFPPKLMDIVLIGSYWSLCSYPCLWVRSIREQWTRRNKIQLTKWKQMSFGERHNDNLPPATQTRNMKHNNNDLKVNESKWVAQLTPQRWHTHIMIHTQNDTSELKQNNLIEWKTQHSNELSLFGDEFSLSSTHALLLNAMHRDLHTRSMREYVCVWKQCHVQCHVHCKDVNLCSKYWWQWKWTCRPRPNAWMTWMEDVGVTRAVTNENKQQSKKQNKKQWITKSMGFGVAVCGLGATMPDSGFARIHQLIHVFSFLAHFLTF